MLSGDLRYFNETDIKSVDRVEKPKKYVEEVERMLKALIKSLEIKYLNP
ncbi:MAG: hypothetical protein SCALA701_29060 [Candidatus Scalindua sp.]|nr:MAG: hypothetical protein SCALA701_29060 [Candidatus Scalindua sp.]